MDFIKKHQRLPVSVLALAISAGISAGNANAGGFEKATLWDAKYSALAGAAVSSVNDSSAVFFNPAGLAFADSNDVALHLSPTITKVNGPAAGSGSHIDGESNFVPSSGLTGLVKLNEQMTLGYGVYASGGASASYKNVTVGSVAPITGDYSTKISIMEAGLAMAYRMNNNWSVGGTYRITYAAADIDLIAATPIPNAAPHQTAGVAIGYNEMSGFEYFGVRLGTMYRSDDQRFGWGVNYRSEVTIAAKGDAKTTNAQGSRTGNVTATTQLPEQISTGIDYAVTQDWTAFGEVTYSNYARVDAIHFTSTNTPLPVNQINTQWHNQYNFRVAGEYTGIEGWALRGGYVLTLPVVPEEQAAPTFSTPAKAHTLTFGAGTTLMNGQVDLDLAAEYNYAKNDHVSGGGQLTDAGTLSPSGKYRTNAYAFHISAKYNF